MVLTVKPWPLFVTLCLVAAGACSPLRPATKPGDEKLVGEWHVSTEYIRTVKRYFECPFSESRLVLTPNHTFTAVKVPIVETSPQGRLLYSCVSTCGTWRVEKQQFWVLTLTYENTNGGISFEVRNDGESFILVDFIVDPDGPFYGFRRVSASPVTVGRLCPPSGRWRGLRELGGVGRACKQSVIERSRWRGSAFRRTSGRSRNARRGLRR
jgi:hypothetical protein